MLHLFLNIITSVCEAVNSVSAFAVFVLGGGNYQINKYIHNM